MKYIAKNKSLVLFFILIALFAVCSESFGFGTIIDSLELMDAMDESSDRRYEYQPSPEDLRAQRAQATNRQNAQTDVVAGINDAYAKMAETLNAHRTPTKDQIASNITTLHIPKATRAYLGDDVLAKYYILMAWNEYFTDDIKTAQKAAIRAFKASPDIEDARVTLTSIILLAGEKAVVIPKKKSIPKTGNTYRNYNMSSQDADLLDLDIQSINTDLTNPESPEKIFAMELNCLNSTTFTYSPGSESLCVIFWQLSDKDVVPVASSEPNNPSARPATVVTAPRGMPRNSPPQYYNEFGGQFGGRPTMNPYGNNTAKKQNPDFLSNTQAFKDLFSAAFDTDNVKFLAVNTDSLANKQKVVGKIMENPWPWAHVMAHDPKSGDTQFKDVSVRHEKPLLVITSNDGTIKYAGPAVGFLAPMMLAKITGQNINANAATATATANHAANGQTSVANKLAAMFNKTRQGNKTNTATNTTAVVNRVSAQPREMDVIDEVAASRLLENARTFIKLSSRAITPKKGIEMCREIFAKYPNTKYSEQARMLLREVPERHRKRYKITDEELGL